MYRPVHVSGRPSTIDFGTASHLIVLAARSIAGWTALVFSPFVSLPFCFHVECLPMLCSTCAYTKDPAWPRLRLVSFPPSFSVSSARVCTPPGCGLVPIFLSNSRLSLHRFSPFSTSDSLVFLHPGPAGLTFLCLVHLVSTSPCINSPRAPAAPRSSEAQVYPFCLAWLGS